MPPAVQGFGQPFDGVAEYAQYGPSQVTRSAQINQPLGQKAADKLAKKLGLNKKNVLTKTQFAQLVSGQGINGNAQDAAIIDASVRILTNTTGNPLYPVAPGKQPIVLASYGLTVNTDGMLESPANATAPPREINQLLLPGGYINTWCLDNGAAKSLEMLYQSAYTPEIPFATESQQITDFAQLATFQQGERTSVAGMSVIPSLFVINFSLIYMLNPKLAAKMPAYWAPIPTPVAQALAATGTTTGQVPYSEYASYFNAPA